MSENTAPFLILAFDHPQRVVESIGDCMAAALRGLGIDAHMLAVPRDTEKLGALPAAPVSGVLALGSVLLNAYVGKDLLHRYLTCPVWLYFVDAPIYDLGRVAATRQFLDDAQSDPRLIPVSPEAGYLTLLGRRAEGGYWPAQARHLPFGCFPRLGIVNQPVARQPRVCVIGTIGFELGGRYAGESLKKLLALTRPVGVNEKPWPISPNLCSRRKRRQCRPRQRCAPSSGGRSN